MNADQALAALEAALQQIAPDVDLARLDPDGDLREQADLDSMDFLSLVTRLSEATGVQADDEDMPRLSSVTGAVRFLVARSSAEPGPGPITTEEEPC